MCGIAGLVGATLDVRRAFITKMMDRIAHRGPDGEGVYCDEMVALGHRRLSIVDLSAAGHQPMEFAERYVITYNGEIYNHIELRAELEREGYRFVSHSDTEVILAAYDFWGRECLERFNGMWAFALYDRRDRTLFLARDRFGVKPLYYWRRADGMFAFGSEIKQFVDLPGWSARVNGQRAYDYLNWGVTDHTHETLFDGVYQVLPGHYALLDLAQAARESNGSATSERMIALTQWYRLSAAPFDGDFAHASDRLRGLLEDSVRLRLRADVPVGSCLSGGLDSSSIVCLMKRQLERDGAAYQQHTFSACSTIGKYDESRHIDTVVAETGVLSHRTYPALEDLFSALSAITWHQDEPFGSTSIFAQWNVFGLAREQGIKVMLDGQGADEQLAGYHSFFAPRFASLFRSTRWLELIREVRAAGPHHGYNGIFAAKQIGKSILPRSVRDLARRTSGAIHNVPSWLSMDRLGAVPGNPFGDGRAHESVRAMSIEQLVRSNLPMLLHWEDRNSMAHGVEARLPFLDYRFVEFALGLPDEYKLSRGVTKRVMREAMQGILPESVRMRMDKMGFVTPEEVWLREQAPDQFRRAMETAIDVSGGIITSAARSLLESMIAGQTPFSFTAWRLVSFGDWLQRFDVRV
ncbi:asparagine synthase (glutamine-hydrolyzing) [Trinickia mobilis]|uniref:asparagine synthase (glutamine-hydrolyzing) n=1 Tax=Trinickia mobilis TaxID=2816356 RepID=UPI001A9007FC|nr:asparagine synthase (glutamine-hydrolyzing) [Trinickia mobilis]